MATRKNIHSPGSLVDWLSPQSVRLLEILAARGIYGSTREEVAARFIDGALQDLVAQGVVKNKRKPEGET